MNTPRAVTALFLLLLLCVSSILRYPQYVSQQSTAAELSTLLSATDTPPLLPRTKSSDCTIHGALPDPDCSPGAVFENADTSTICHPGYTKTVRNVSTKLKQIVFAEYGIPYPQPFGSFEVDHIIPLAIGGSNDIANLFPEAAAPTPGFREKDLVEVYLQQEACAGRIDLSSAQRQIAKDWLSIYQSMSPEDIKLLKNKYRNWSN
jgi:hypothetical protein